MKKNAKTKKVSKTLKKQAKKDKKPFKKGDLVFFKSWLDDVEDLSYFGVDEEVWTFIQYIEDDKYGIKGECILKSEYNGDSDVSEGENDTITMTAKVDELALFTNEVEDMILEAQEKAKESKEVQDETEDTWEWNDNESEESEKEEKKDNDKWLYDDEEEDEMADEDLAEESEDVDFDEDNGDVALTQSEKIEKNIEDLQKAAELYSQCLETTEEMIKICEDYLMALSSR